MNEIEITHFKEEELSWRLEEWEKVKAEDRFNFNGRHLRLVSFVSRSRGRNENGDRLRRRPREVELLVVDGRYSLPVRRGEIVSKRNDMMAPKPDNLAEEVLGSGATVSDLYFEVRRRQWGY